MDRQKYYSAMLSAPAPNRYEHFIKTAADREEIWVLEHEGYWAMASLDEGELVFPVWPDREFARLCAVDLWEKYEPGEVKIEELLEEIIPTMLADGVKFAVFPLPRGQGAVVEVEVLRRDLLAELSRYG